MTLRLAHSDDPETSKAMALINRDGIRRRVAEILWAHPDGLTDDEVHAIGTGTRHRHSTATRRLELTDAGLVEPTQTRRPTPDGNAAVVWRWTGDASQPQQTPPPQGSLFEEAP